MQFHQPPRRHLSNSIAIITNAIYFAELSWPLQRSALITCIIIDNNEIDWIDIITFRRLRHCRFDAFATDASVLFSAISKIIGVPHIDHRPPTERVTHHASQLNSSTLDTRPTTLISCTYFFDFKFN
jgi:hypothetical protein